MDTNDLSAFKDLFIKTAGEHIASMQKASEVLSGDLTNVEARREIFVAAHSLKGESYAIGHMSTGALSHMVEKVFYELKEQKLVLSPEVLQVMRKAIAKLEESIACIDKENKEAVTTDVLMELEKVTGITVTG